MATGSCGMRKCTCYWHQSEDVYRLESIRPATLGKVEPVELKSQLLQVLAASLDMLFRLRAIIRVCERLRDEAARGRQPDDREEICLD